MPNDESAPLELEPLGSEVEDEESTPPEYQITTYPADYTLEVLHRKWISREILVPDFQRLYVWKRSQASKLIESFLVGLPVPAVFFYVERHSNKYIVIDGQQRLKSIFFYLDGYYEDDGSAARSEFRLMGINRDSRYYNKAFDDLTEEDRRKLNDSVLRAFIVQQLNPDDDTSMYHIFERLNTGGTLLANQEIRNCVYQGNLSNFLDEINKFEAWRDILGKSREDSRKKDVELLLRFLALRDASGYDSPMKDFLSRFMKKHKDASEERLQGSRELFTRTCEAVIANLGEKPFHVRSGLMNAAVFDSVMTAFSRHLDSIPEDIRERYRNLVDSEEFEKNTRSSTTNVDVVKRRLRQADEYLFGA